MSELRTASWRTDPDSDTLQLFMTDGVGSFYTYRFQGTADLLSFMAQGLKLAHLQEVRTGGRIHDKES